MGRCSTRRWLLQNPEYVDPQGTRCNERLHHQWRSDPTVGGQRELAAAMGYHPGGFLLQNRKPLKWEALGCHQCIRLQWIFDSAVVRRRGMAAAVVFRALKASPTPATSAQCVIGQAFCDHLEPFHAGKTFEVQVPVTRMDVCCDGAQE